MSQAIHLVEIDCYVNSLSNSSHIVGTGVKEFVNASGPPAYTGMMLRVEKADDAAVWMEGLVTESTDEGFVINVRSMAGTGTHSAWRLAAGTLFFSSGEYDHPTARAPYEPVIAPDGYAQGSTSLHGDGRSFGVADVEMSYIKVINAGSRDHLRRYAYFGRLARELVIDGPDAPFSTATVLRSGTIEQPAVGTGDVLFRWKSRLSDLDSRWQSGTFPGGTGAAMSTDGTDSLKDQCRPVLRGYRAQIEPVPTNVGGDLRQISSKRIHGVEDGRNKGVPIPTGTRHDTLAALKAATPADGTFDWYNGSGGDGAWCKTSFGSQAGVFTLAAWEGATVGDRSLAQVWRRIIIEDCGYAESEVSAADVAAMDAACPWEAGVWAGTSERTKRDALNDLCEGVAAFYDDDTGVWRLVYDGADAGTPSVIFHELLGDDEDAPSGHVPYVSLEPVTSKDDTKGLPVCGVDVEFSPRDRVLAEGDMAGDKDALTDPVGGAAVRKEMSSETLTAAWPEGGSEQGIIKLWGERRLKVTTALRHRAHALALAQRLFAVHSVPRDRFKLVATLTAETAQARPGGHAGIVSSRYGLKAGLTCRVNGREFEGATATYDLLEAP